MDERYLLHQAEKTDTSSIRTAANSGELGVRGIRCFFFQDGLDIAAERGFREMARLSGGAYLRLGPDSAKELAELLSAVALYARGGLKALSESTSSEARLLLEQLKR